MYLKSKVQIGITAIVSIWFSNCIGESTSFTFIKCCSNLESFTRTNYSGTQPHGESKNISLSYSCEGESTQESDPSSSKGSWNIYKFPNDLNPVSTMSSDAFFNFGQVSENRTPIPTCKTINFLENGEEIWFRILENGEIVVGLHFWIWPIWLKVSQKSGYCLDNVQLSESFHRNHIHPQLLVFCELDNYNIYKLHRLLYGISFMISAIFLSLTVAIFLVSKWGQGSTNIQIHSWLQFSYFLALLLFYLSEGGRIWTKFDGLDIHPSGLCFIHAVIAEYFTLTLSLSIFALAVHMLWTFWKMQPLNSACKKLKGRDIFCLILLPWIIPIFGLGSGLLYNHFTNENAAKEEIGLSQFGHYRCVSPTWFVGSAVFTVLFILNVIYFLITAGVILNTIYISTFAKKPGSRSRFATDTFHLLLKISLIMGIFWGFTIYEVTFGENASNPLHFFWAFVRIVFFGLQGLWLFFAFGCTESNRKALGCRGLPFVGGGSEKVFTSGMSDTNTGSEGQAGKVWTMQCCR